ncbi:MAG: hypothetical protein GEU73_14435 [Chloroflexi bacterium]|nr:hypothetical protein [Chloroflexota bacterium]
MTTTPGMTGFSKGCVSIPAGEWSLAPSSDELPSNEFERRDFLMAALSPAHTLNNLTAEYLQLFNRDSRPLAITEDGWAAVFEYAKARVEVAIRVGVVVFSLRSKIEASGLLTAEEIVEQASQWLHDLEQRRVAGIDNTGLRDALAGLSAIEYDFIIEEVDKLADDAGNLAAGMALKSTHRLEAVT